MKCLNNCGRDAVVKFCGRSCASAFNNTMFPKRCKSIKCKNCSNLVYSGWTYCSCCIQENKHIRTKYTFPVNTIVELSKGTDANKYSRIRSHARSVVRRRPQRCLACGYDKHVEVCHIQAITDFDISATLAEVNNPDNLVLLCPNCHWEFDHKKSNVIMLDTRKSACLRRTEKAKLPHTELMAAMLSRTAEGEKTE